MGRVSNLLSRILAVHLSSLLVGTLTAILLIVFAAIGMITQGTAIAILTTTMLVLVPIYDLEEGAALHNETLKNMINMQIRFNDESALLVRMTQRLAGDLLLHLEASDKEFEKK